MSRPIRAAIFGNGFARTTMLPCLRHVDGLDVVGLASPNLERAQATANEFGIPQVTADYRELLSVAAPDLVFIVTPPHRHLEMAVDALAAGCHVVCEKPTAMNQGESLKMLAASRAYPDRLALIDHELRVDPRRRQLKQWVETGRLGRILHATYTVSSFFRRDPTAPWTWWSDREQGGGAWGAIGSHVIDSLRSLLGEIDEVRGDLSTVFPERIDPQTGRARLVTSDDAANAWLRFRSGARATVAISLVEGERVHRLQLSGTDGAAQLDEQQPLRFAAGVAAGRNGWEEIEWRDDLAPSVDLGIPDTDWARNFLRFAREITAALASGRATVEGASTFEDGHRNQQVLDAVRASAESARWVDVRRES